MSVCMVSVYSREEHAQQLFDILLSSVIEI